jgi:hypothetical protein
MSVKDIAVIVLSVSLLKPPFGGFRSETVTWIQKWFKKSDGTSRKLMVFQGGDDGRGYRNMCKIPRGSNSNDGH